MKNQRKIRFFAFILTLCLTLGALPLYVLADEGEEIPEELKDRIVEEIPFEPEYLPGDLTFAECRTATLNMAEVPAVISQAQIEQYQHVNRLYEQEPDLYTVIFQNRDGSKTVYVFAQPVKSTLGNGAVADMSAAAIVSAHQPALPSQNAMMQNSLLQNVAPILAMQERLDSYKAANDLKDYQMLDDVLETTTVNASAASVLVMNNSVSVASVSTTYSPLSGEYAIKLPNNTGYLTCINNGITTRSYVSVPYAKWLFEYYGNSQYAIQSLSKQGYYLSYVDEDYCGLEQWEDSDEGNETVLWTMYPDFNETGYTIALGGYALADNATMVSESYEPVCQLTNHTTFVPLTSISISQTVITANVDEYVYVPTIYTNPENASYAISDSDFVWITTDDSMLTPDMDSFFVLETGIAQIYCKHLYTGLESNRVTVIVSETPPAGEAITSGAVYLIRPYADIINRSTNTPLLTMNIGNPNTIAIDSLKNPWKTVSQAFSFTENPDGSYKISAIMCTNQYYVPFSGSSSLPYTGAYTLTDKNTVANTLSRSSATTVSLKVAVDSNGVNQLTDTDKWFVYIENGKHYIINVGGSTVYYLNYNTDLNAVSVSTTKSSCDWKITFFGLDAPLIKQTTDYYCGVASTLQVLMGSQANGYTGNFDLRERMDLLRSTTTIIRNNMGYISGIKDALNSIIGAGKFEILEPRYWTATNQTEILGSINETIAKSLQNGSPAITNVTSGLLHYYPSSGAYLSNGHFICIIGYDENTGLLLLSDCIYESHFGLHLIYDADLFEAKRNGLVYRNVK